MSLRHRTPRTRTVPSAASARAGAGLVGGFAVGQGTGRRDLAGVVFAVAGVLAARDWARTSGGSHPLAHRTGPWPAVGIVTAALVGASEAVTRRGRH